MNANVINFSDKMFNGYVINSRFFGTPESALIQWQHAGKIISVTFRATFHMTRPLAATEGISRNYWLNVRITADVDGVVLTSETYEKTAPTQAHITGEAEGLFSYYRDVIADWLKAFPASVKTDKPAEYPVEHMSQGIVIAVISDGKG